MHFLAAASIFFSSSFTSSSLHLKSFLFAKATLGSLKGARCAEVLIINAVFVDSLLNPNFFLK